MAAPRAQHEPRDERVTRVVLIRDVEVHLEGEGAEALVFVHGWPDTHRLWDAQVAALKDRYRCVRFTLPGFDASAPRRSHSLGELCSFLDEVIEQACPGATATLVLHDWGCIFGYQYAMRRPERVARIVGIDIGDPASLGRVLTAREKLGVLAYQLWLALAWNLGGRLGDRMTRAMARAARAPADPATIHSGMDYPYHVLWFGGARSYRRESVAFRPACPMLFVYGRRKPVRFHARRWAEELAARPGNAVVEFDTGHWVMAEQPQRFNEVMAEWLARTPAGSAPAARK